MMTAVVIFKICWTRLD